MTEWQKETLKLDDNHTWKVMPGYKIFVSGAGAIRFDIPKEWIVVPGANTFKFHDFEPPGDNCTLEVSLIFHSIVNWSTLPLPRLVQKVIIDSCEQASGQEYVRTISRPGTEIAWTEFHFTDAHEHRKARSRMGIARGRNLHAIFTFNFWLDDIAVLDKVWDELLRSMQLEVPVKDPSLGPVVM